jgi:hypothetical protein
MQSVTQTRGVVGAAVHLGLFTDQCAVRMLQTTLDGQCSCGNAVDNRDNRDAGIQTNACRCEDAHGQQFNCAPSSFAMQHNVPLYSVLMA